MPLNHFSCVFQISTDPTNRAQAEPRTGGWTEGFWSEAAPAALIPLIRQYATGRALMLPGEASIVGYRVQSFTIQGNRLLPGGTQSAPLLFPGRQLNTDIPQATLRCGVTTNNGTNSSRINIVDLPDAQVSNGEYQPDGIFRLQLTALTAVIVRNSFGWVGRDLTQGSVRIMSYATNVFVTSAAVPGVAVGDFIRLHRVYDDTRSPMRGAFQVTAVAANGVTVLNGPKGTVSNPSGTMRKDLLSFFPITDVVPEELIVRKIGRPLHGYRGRRSKRR